jgi:hypothetical protein
MADWTNLPNTAVGVGGLPSGTTVTALRDNPVAIAEGAAGAPRNVLGSLSRLVNGAEIKIRKDGPGLAGGNTPSNTFTTIFSTGFMQAGSASITYEFRRQGANVNRTARILRTRASTTTTLQTDTTSSTSYQLRTLTLDILPGDIYFIEGDGFFDGNIGSGGKTEFRNVRVLCSSDTVLFPVDNFGFHENIGVFL